MILTGVDASTVLFRSSMLFRLLVAIAEEVEAPPTVPSIPASASSLRDACAKFMVVIVKIE